MINYACFNTALANTTRKLKQFATLPSYSPLQPGIQSKALIYLFLLVSSALIARNAVALPSPDLVCNHHSASYREGTLFWRFVPLAIV